MSLLNLAPDIQEGLLYLPEVIQGKATIHERLLRPLTREIDWRGAEEDVGEDYEMTVDLRGTLTEPSYIAKLLANPSSDFLHHTSTTNQ